MNGPSKARFETIYQEGRRVSGRCLRFISLPGDGLVGIAVAKALGCHARRRRQVRRVREALRQNPMEPLKGLDLVVTIRPGASETSFHDLAREAGELMEKTAGLWAENSGCS